MLIFQQSFQIGINEDLCFAPTEGSTQSVLPSDETIMLPFSINGSSLIAEKLISYDGAFLENKSGCEVVNLAALLLRNTSEQGISSVSITLRQGSRNLVFSATCIPPRATVLVLEKNGKLFSKESLTFCHGDIDWDNDGWEIEDVLSIERVDIGSLRIKNITEKTLHKICLSYKTSYAEGMFYLGGITYEVNIESLAPGERIFLRPEHYAGESSGFVHIQYNDH